MSTVMIGQEVAALERRLERVEDAIEAVAYEQRTANLIAHVRALTESGPLGEATKAEAVLMGLQIRQRLGLDS